MDYHGMTRLLNINTMDPSEALSAAAQIGVALADFAGRRGFPARIRSRLVGD
jgi:hypothetical protein